MIDKATKIGLFGGSFDPFHLGHLILAKDAMEQFELGRIVFIPASHSPLKAASPAADGKDRLAALQSAVACDPHLEVTDLEIKREGKSYTLHTVRRFREKYEENRLFWIVGADQFAKLDQWHAPDALCQLCEFIVIRRPGYSAQMPGNPPEGLVWHPMKPRLIDISSSEIRKRLATGRPYAHFLPPGVAAYIKEHNLYRINPMNSNKSIPAYGSS